MKAADWLFQLMYLLFCERVCLTLICRLQIGCFDVLIVYFI